MGHTGRTEQRKRKASGKDPLLTIASLTLRHNFVFCRPTPAVFLEKAFGISWALFNRFVFNRNFNSYRLFQSLHILISVFS